MDANELLARFPTIREAVAWCELYAPWPELIDSVRDGTGVGEIVSTFADVIAETLAEDDPPNARQLLKAREQLARPEFRQYLGDRLGLM